MMWPNSESLKILTSSPETKECLQPNEELSQERGRNKIQEMGYLTKERN